MKDLEKKIKDAHPTLWTKVKEEKQKEGKVKEKKQKEEKVKK